MSYNLKLQTYLMSKVSIDTKLIEGEKEKFEV